MTKSRLSLRVLNPPAPGGSSSEVCEQCSSLSHAFVSEPNSSSGYVDGDGICSSMGEDPSGTSSGVVPLPNGDGSGEVPSPPRESSGHRSASDPLVEPPGESVTSAHISRGSDATFKKVAKKKSTVWTHYYPEGGWGWIIVVVASCVVLINCGSQFSYGILFPWIRHGFAHTSEPTLGKICFFSKDLLFQKFVERCS